MGSFNTIHTESDRGVDGYYARLNRACGGTRRGPSTFNPHRFMVCFCEGRKILDDNSRFPALISAVQWGIVPFNRE